MSYVRGLVLLSRFEYLDYKQGISALKQLLKKVSSSEANFVRQPVDGANLYPAEILGTIDEVLLLDHFDQNLDEFIALGEWNAENLMGKYFNLYMEDRDPKQFLEQFARLRNSLIGAGNMTIADKGKTGLEIVIDYGQTVPRTVCLSEKGFISKGLSLCGARNVVVSEKISASDGTSLESVYEVSYR